MEFDFVRSVGVLVAIVVVGIAGLAAMDVMQTDTLFMMVLPSMIAFAVVSFFLGMKHGEFRASP
ncbi:DUF7333 family protein [Halobacterium litoreum]|uniref:Uncharacterized protein n=1 Tax=Halobacterium litoreum TaxID=2039234 RepID=A0ABD5NDI0_9EURY|nr:hypothetical protein [Halobacterium litoreum]UHH14016.1 hypothetical protein LT972_03210 [Halobacterium litoreum]